MLVLFGGSQLPKLASNLGKAQKEFKDGLDEGSQGDEVADAVADERTDATRHVEQDSTRPSRLLSRRRAGRLGTARARRQLGRRPAPGGGA